MIVYGKRKSAISTQENREQCDNCGTRRSIQLRVYQHYLHVFWIPFFPLRKTGVSECRHCGQVLNKKDFSSNLESEYTILKFNSRTPLWTFIGIGLLLILSISGIYNRRQRAIRSASYIANPIVDDLYKVKRDIRHYTLFKVDKVAGDTVFLLVSLYETNKFSGLSELISKGNAAYDLEPIPMLRWELIEMFEKGEIMRIIRN